MHNLNILNQLLSTKIQQKFPFLRKKQNRYNAHVDCGQPIFIVLHDICAKLAYNHFGIQSQHTASCVCDNIAADNSVHFFLYNFDAMDK